MRFSTSTVAAVAAFFTSGVVNAHMEMRIPYPYGPATLNNSPLENGMADFPCKQRPGVYEPPEQENILTVGETFPLEFLGDAVHGGGSCQVSLTEDMQPTKDSVWKVIHSIEGGCPANTAGNLGGDANGMGATKFKIMVPESIQPGEYTLAWTWINRIGNREFYMNCAPVTVQGPKKKRYAPTPVLEPRSSIALTKRADLPEMFVANINGCKTPHGVDVRYPNAGSSLEQVGDIGNLMDVGATICEWENEPSKAGPIAGDGDSGNQKPAPKPEPTPETKPEPTPETKPGNFAPEPVDPEPTTAPAPVPEPTGPVPVPTPSPSTPEEEKPAPPPSTGNGGSALSGPCSEAGMFNCIGGNSFQQCASGQWSVAQPLAQGTACKEGISADLGVEAIQVKKRGIHRRRGHFRA